MKTRSETIAQINDALRIMQVGGEVMLTQGIVNLPPVTRDKIIQAMREYDDFAPDGDPYGEHDFGTFEVDGFKCFFKITYFDPTMEFGSDDPANPEVTKRVLTLMLAEEY